MECHILSCTIQERIRGDSVRMCAGKWKAFQQQRMNGNQIHDQDMSKLYFFTIFINSSYSY